MNDRTAVTPVGFDPELHAIRQRVAAGLWPEHAAEASVLQRAVAFCAFGIGRRRVEVGGHTTTAAIMVAVLGLDDFVARRQAAALNLN